MSQAVGPGTMAGQMELRRQLVCTPDASAAIEQAFSELVLSAEPAVLNRLARWQMVLRAGRPTGAADMRRLAHRLHRAERARNDMLGTPKATHYLQVAGRRILFAADDLAGSRFFSRAAPDLQGYEPDLVRYLATAVAPGSVFVDVGAHVGFYSCLAAGLGASVLAVEAHPLLVHLIRRNAALNGFHRIQPICAAAGRSAGLTALARLDPSPGTQVVGLMPANSAVFGLHHRNLDWVPVVTLDDLLADLPDHPILVKVDVEGMELAVLEGSRRLIEERRAGFVIELHRQGIAAFGGQPDALRRRFPTDLWSWSALGPGGPAPIDPDRITGLLDPAGQETEIPSLVLRPR